jgi:hypothetical protein
MAGGRNINILQFQNSATQYVFCIIETGDRERHRDRERVRERSVSANSAVNCPDYTVLIVDK